MPLRSISMAIKSFDKVSFKYLNSAGVTFIAFSVLIWPKVYKMHIGK